MRLFFKKSLLVVFMVLAIITLNFSNLITKADTKSEAYEVKVTSGIEGKYRALKYIPVTVEFTSLEKDFNGEVEIRTSGSYSSTYDAYSKEISVSEGETGKVTIPIKLLEGYSKITVNLVENGKVLFEKKSLISNGRVSESNLFMGVLSDDQTSLSYTGSISFTNTNNPGYNGVIEKVQLDEKIIGENSLNIDGLDIILINNYNMSNLKDEQYNALNSWINKGGTLIIGSGANEGKTVKNIDNNFLDIKSNGSKEKNIKLINDDLKLIVSNLEIKDGKLKSGSNDTPLAYSVTRGKGEIIVTTFDLGLEPLISSKDSGEFFKNIISDASNTFFQNSMNGGYNQQYYRTSELTRNIPINKIVSVKSLIVVLSLYALIVGIIAYLVLKKLNKRDLTWIAIPVISIVFAFIIYFMGSSTRVNDIVLNQNNIVSVDKSGKASIKGYLGIGSKYKADVIIEKPENLNMSYLTADNYYYGNPDEDTVSNVLRVKTTYSGNNSYFTFSNSDALDMKTFQVVGKEEIISKIESSFNLSEGNLNGKVKNTLGYYIKKLIVVAGRNVWDIGSINKDEEKDFSDLKVAGANGLQAYSDTLNQKYYDAKWNKKGDINSEEFENILRVSALIGAVSEEISINRDIKLIAITKLPIDYDINFNNKSVSKFDTTAIVQDIDLDFKDKDGNYNFPDGYFDYTVESSSTNVHIDDYGGYIYGQGEVVFKYEIDENIEVLDLIIKEGIDRYGYSQGDNAEKYIYNYKTGTYDKFLMSQGYEKIKDLENYIDNNTVKVKYIVTDSGKGGQSMIPRITVKGRDR
ncbi:hypothetical protein H9660_00520 [Clostridium sp. Sa3CUN1]|uniref:Membrane-associated protein n=1 Tax=Clostridium gallinarum TaxID=2762246 RepID=A0ABR8PZM4_9CLOT|nr:hypothetical protein [Clostridium gallinarum]MBD7913621.1 hypothetical protein [Clostridium gallinarum]